jgi:hypothetical protein
MMGRLFFYSSIYIQECFTSIIHILFRQVPYGWGDRVHDGTQAGGQTASVRFPAGEHGLLHRGREQQCGSLPLLLLTHQEQIRD